MAHNESTLMASAPVPLDLFARRKALQLAVRMRASSAVSNAQAVAEAASYVERIADHLGAQIDNDQIAHEIEPLLGDLERMMLENNLSWSQVCVAPHFATERSELVFHRDWCLVTFERACSEQTRRRAEGQCEK